MKSPGATVREYTPEDAAHVLAINQSNVPEVGTLDARKLERLIAEADWVPVVEVQDEVVGFAILLVEGADYASTNYGWFSERHGRFYYVDRIALEPGARGQGIGQTLYHEAVRRARATGRGVLCAEVNTIPLNEPSLHFHERFGFVHKARRCPYGDENEVVMLERSIE